MTRTAALGMLFIIGAVAIGGHLLWSAAEADMSRILLGAAGLLILLAIAAWHEDRRLVRRRRGAKLPLPPRPGAHDPRP